MHNSCERSAQRSATVILVALLLAAGIAVIAAGTANAAQYKMVMCAGTNGVPAYSIDTNTISAANPGGIFEFHNWCGGVGSDPPGESAYLRINENQAAGNAGQGAYGDMIFATPPYVHFKAAGGFTREPGTFNEGWRARFWASELSGYQAQLLTQGAGLPNTGTQSATTGAFAPHLWPFYTYLDFNRFAFELICVKPYGCDRANFNATDANGFVFILSDNSDAQVGFTPYNPELTQGSWVRGAQGMIWDVSDQGSGLRAERLLVDGAQRYAFDNGCDLGVSAANGEYARTWQPCPTGGPWRQGFDLDTASLPDGAHSLSICARDYAQYQGLNGTGGETCDTRTIHTDNTAPGAPLGLQVTSANPERYLDRFGASFSLPSNQGSSISKVHYNVLNAIGEVVVPEQAISSVNPTRLQDITGPSKAGEYRLRVWLEDAVGLSGPASIASIPHDTTPPPAPQELSVTAPGTARTAQAFDVRWHNITDSGSPIDAVHYQVVNRAGAVLVPTQTIAGNAPQTIADLDAPTDRGPDTLRLWLSDAEGNVGAPVSAPLAYECVRSEEGAGTALTAAVSPDGKSSVLVQQGTGAMLSGRLLDAGGRGVPGAPLCVFSTVITDHAAEFLGVAITGTDGGYRLAVPAGASRNLTVTYRSSHREITAAGQIATRVKPSFDVRRKVVHNKGVAHFEGWIPGPHNDSVVVVLQVKRGSGWLAFHRYRTREDGHFTVGYRFNRTFRPTIYEMRAQVREQSGYPYLQGTSEPLRLVVLPARRTGR